MVMVVVQICSFPLPSLPPSLSPSLPLLSLEWIVTFGSVSEVKVAVAVAEAVLAVATAEVAVVRVEERGGAKRDDTGAVPSLPFISCASAS
jgi:hypothetical protein